MLHIQQWNYVPYRTPSNIAVKGNLEQLSDPTLDLQPFKVLNVFPRQLDLVDMRIDW